MRHEGDLLQACMYVLFAFSYWQKKVAINFKHRVAKVTMSFSTGLLQNNLKLSESSDDIFMNKGAVARGRGEMREPNERLHFTWKRIQGFRRDSHGHLGQAQQLLEFCLDRMDHIFSLKSGTMWWGGQTPKPLVPISEKS